MEGKLSPCLSKSRSELLHHMVHSFDPFWLALESGG